eukprot:TRINITY_DN47097_c0_g1_i1.p1 TRINITY_DN47097_c0_g1~~TRINITY_DN47097_c0_g1_i1.p1  ORF type:complete len:303 (+),score=64.50 TRINITY_DN47097_c0_g1_i1:131-910(+)
MDKHGGSALPQDHEDQMQLGIRIITSAFQNKMHSLEQEIRGMRLTCEEQKQNVASLAKKNSSLEGELVESVQRSQQLTEENKELFKTVGSLRKQIARLEALKSAVMTSIQDDQAAEADLGDTRALMSEEFLRGATPLTTRELTYGGGAGGGMMNHSGHASYREDGGGTGSVGGLNLGAAAAPGAGAAPSSPVIDGKQFFRQARSRLSYEAFNLFLASIKRLNSQTQTREETLDEARRIFGTELQDLYKDFESLLNRHGM